MLKKLVTSMDRDRNFITDLPRDKFISFMSPDVIQNCTSLTQIAFALNAIISRAEELVRILSIEIVIRLTILVNQIYYIL